MQNVNATFYVTLFEKICVLDKSKVNTVMTFVIFLQVAEQCRRSAAAKKL